MGTRHYVEGQIDIDPPVTPDEIKAKKPDIDPDDLDGLHLTVPAVGEHAGHGVGIDYSAGGDDPNSWWRGDTDLAAAVQALVDAYGTAPDGTKRTFTGFLDCVAYCDEGDSPYRIAVADDKASVYDPTILWPEAAGGDPPPTVSIATVSTRHFDFTAVAATEAAARQALMDGWLAHAADTGADPNLLTADEFNVITGPLGQAWRDHTPLLTNQKG